MSKTALPRRNFIKQSALGSAAVVAGLLSSGRAFAAMCSEKLEVAAKLKYVKDFAAALKAKKFTDQELNFKNRGNPKKLKKAADMNCANCIFYGQTKPKVCTLIPGCEVEAKGWCIMWAGKP